MTTTTTTTSAAPLTADEVTAIRAKITALLAVGVLGAGNDVPRLLATLADREARLAARDAEVAALVQARNDWRHRAEARVGRIDALVFDLEQEHIERTAYEGLYRRLLDDVTDALGLDPNAWDTEGGDDLAHAAILTRCCDLVATAANVRAALSGERQP